MSNKLSLPSIPARQPLDFTPNKPWPRDYLYPILETALQVKEYRFARQTALHWLASYPGDLPIDLIHGQALLGEGHLKQARKAAQRLCQRDPEYLAAQELLGQTHYQPGQSKTLATTTLKRAGKTLHDEVEPDSALAALTHLRILTLRPDTPRSAVQSLAQHFHLRWPECVQFMLLLAAALIDGGDADQAVALLHRAAAYDITGQVVKRLWGADHPYTSLWPTQMRAMIPNPIPARLAAALGWNLLDSPPPPAHAAVCTGRAKEQTLSGNGNNPKPSRASAPQTEKRAAPRPDPQPTRFISPADDLPETLRSVRDELGRIGERLQQPALAKADGRYPTYIVFSARRGLQQKYGRAGFAMLDAAMQELAETIRGRAKWGALVFYADDPACAARAGVKPAQADDAWAFKLALADLDQALCKKGAMIGAVLIVGGPQVIPFHSLPNPTDDLDIEVPSDNPYATRDENYFIPEWPVGRLPDEAGTNPALILGSLQAMIAFHAQHGIQSLPWWKRLGLWWGKWLRAARPAKTDSLGYSAEVWRKASLAVYQQIGSPKELQTSPPLDVLAAKKERVSGFEGKLGYFNLHGLADTGAWYGQRDPANGSAEIDYPVALRTQDVIKGGSTPEIIFSEACYGAHVLEKSVENSLALKFLAAGCRALAGSTVMSYGSISTPLNAADLLGIAFWKNLKNGLPAGDALRRAKIHLAREMHKRQGYLDGEDQKTLISFVLYGDPLATPSNDRRARQKRGKMVVRAQQAPPKVKTVCDRAATPGQSDPIPAAVMTQIKRVVTQYLPGMQGAAVTMSHEHLDCRGEGHHCPTGAFGAKAHPAHRPERRVVTLSKQIPLEKHTHPAYARLTLDKAGKVVKLAVSR